MSTGAQAYARTARTTASPRDIEAQALLKAARKLQDVMTNWGTPEEGLEDALMFNRKLWSIFLGDAMSEESQQTIEVRQNIANLGIFILTQCAALKLKPEIERFQSLIDINTNIAAGLSGRG